MSYTTPTKHDGRAVLFAVAELLVTALHGMQTRYSDEKAVRLSICQTRALRQNEKRSVQIFIQYERTFCLVY